MGWKESSYPTDFFFVVQAFVKKLSGGESIYLADSLEAYGHDLGLPVCHVGAANDSPSKAP